MHKTVPLCFLYINKSYARFNCVHFVLFVNDQLYPQPLKSRHIQRTNHTRDELSPL